MKYFIVFFLLLSVNSYSQRTTEKTQTSKDEVKYTSNFIVSNGKLIWRKVFEERINLKDYEKFLKIGANLDNIEISDDSVIVGRLRNRKLSLVGFKDGLLSSEVAPYLKMLFTTGDIKIEVKADKYRITVFNIKMVAEITAAFWQKGEEDELEQYYFKPFSKKKYVSKNFKTYSEPIFDKNFIDILKYKIVKSDF
jgi:hypothetical protein